MATEEIQISELELADSLLEDMLFPVESATDTNAATLLQLKKWLGSSLPTGFILPAIGRIDDARFTLLDGKTLSRNGTYSEFCNKVIEQVQLGNWFACSQSEYDEDLSSKGQCGRFVIEDDYVRIPTITRYIGATVTLSEFGQAFNESLPNITGEFDIAKSAGYSDTASGNVKYTSGAFFIKGKGESSGSGAAWSGTATLYGLDASRASSTYQDGAKVNVEHVKYPYYMVISTEGQTTPISVDINKVHEDINLKANKDLSDVTQIGKETVVGWGMPDYSAGVSISQSGFTAEFDGLLVIQALSQGNANNCTVVLNNTELGFNKETSYNNSTRFIGFSVPVPKNTNVSFLNINNWSYGYFFPFKGVNND